MFCLGEQEEEQELMQAVEELSGRNGQLTTQLNTLTQCESTPIFFLFTFLCSYPILFLLEKKQICIGRVVCGLSAIL